MQSLVALLFLLGPRTSIHSAHAFPRPLRARCCLPTQLILKTNSDSNTITFHQPWICQNAATGTMDQLTVNLSGVQIITSPLCDSNANKPHSISCSHAKVW